MLVVTFELEWNSNNKDIQQSRVFFPTCVYLYVFLTTICTRLWYHNYVFPMYYAMLFYIEMATYYITITTYHTLSQQITPMRVDTWISNFLYSCLFYFLLHHDYLINRLMVFPTSTLAWVIHKQCLVVVDFDLSNGYNLLV